MPPTMKFSPQKTHEITHAVTVGKGGSGGARQGSWDVPSAHSLDRTAAQISVMDQFDAATTIQQHSRGMVDRGKVGEVVRQLAPGEHTIYDLSAQIRQGKTSQPGKASNSFELRDAYATSPYGQGYGFVNNRHDQFGSTDGFNESKTSALADPKIHPQMRVKSGYTGHVPHARDHVGSTYRMHDNRGSAGKTMVPIPHQDISPPNDEMLAKAKRNLTYHAGLAHVDVIAGHENVSTINVPTRIQKIFCEDPAYTIKGGENFTPKAYNEGANPMVGYTGHTPFARDIVGTNYYGPTEGNNWHGPAMPPDPAGFVRASSPNKFAECP